MTDVDTRTPQSKRTIFQELDYITGHDEQAIAKSFGADVWDTYDLAFPQPTEFDEAPRPSRSAAVTLHRMLIFADKVHAGQKAGEARETALSMAAGDVLTYFDDGEDDSDKEGDAETAVGKADTASE